MRVRVIDAFSDRAFAGNPAAVCQIEGFEWPDDAWLGAVAGELNLPMTAFVAPRPYDADADWGLRWFSARAREEPICGHATLAAGHALAEDRGGAPGSDRFATLSGVLTTHGAADGTITLDFPAASVAERPAPEGLAAALGAAPDATHATGPLRDVLAVFADAAAVRALAPDMAALADLSRREDLRGITATAPAEPGSGHDFVSRFFSPADGMPEDAVTGSAHTALAPYWAQRLGRDGLTGLQVSARGGVLRTELRGDRVHIGGRAVTVFDGTLRAGR
jgi:PhzF family phenazine biosynthesis protein